MPKYANQKSLTIKKTDTKKGNNFLLVDKDVFFEAMLDLGWNSPAFAIYTYLVSNSNGYSFDVSKEHIMKLTGISKNSYYNGIEILEQKGYITYIDNERVFIDSLSLVGTKNDFSLSGTNFSLSGTKNSLVGKNFPSQGQNCPSGGIVIVNSSNRKLIGSIGGDEPFPSSEKIHSIRKEELEKFSDSLYSWINENQIQVKNGDKVYIANVI